MTPSRSLLLPLLAPAVLLTAVGCTSSTDVARPDADVSAGATASPSGATASPSSPAASPSTSAAAEPEPEPEPEPEVAPAPEPEVAPAPEPDPQPEADAAAQVAPALADLRRPGTGQEDEQTYVASMRLRGGPAAQVASDDELLMLGYGFCWTVDGGLSPVQVLQGLEQSGTDPGFSTVVWTAASATLCPEYRGLT